QAAGAGPGCRWGRRPVRGGVFLTPRGGRALWPPASAASTVCPMTWVDEARSWRPTLHALAGLVAGLGVGAVLSTLVVVWLAAVWSLVDWPVGGWGHATLYVAVVLAGPVLL